MATHCFDILLDGKLPASKTGKLARVIGLVGSDGFLRRETVHSILELSELGQDDIKSFDGEECAWIDVHDELATLSLFESSALRIASVNSADKLIKSSRDSIEKWCASAAEGSVLILQIQTLASNTKLYKLLDSKGWLVQCGLPTSSPRSKTPSEGELKRWLRAWAERKHELKLTANQATTIVGAVGMECGLLHQELAKLSLYSDDKGKISDEMIAEHVGSWRTRTMWDIADAIAEGRTADALEQLQRVFAAGEVPAAVIPQISWSLRRYALAANLILQSKRLGKAASASAAIGKSGFWGKDIQLAEQRLRRMGLRRGSKLLTWLLELDLKIKGSHSTPSRAVFALEELCLKMA
ncbi:MAG: DNA polymerase III subunit delta [Aureliella sp.]